MAERTWLDEKLPPPKTPLTDLLYDTWKLAGWDIRVPDEQFDLAQFLRMLRLREEANRAARERHITRILAILGCIGTIVISAKIQSVLAWIASFLPG